MEICRLRSFGHFQLAISVCGDPVRYKWRQHAFNNLQNPVNWRWSFPGHRKITLDGTAQ
jgi:hypothetical protein